MTIGGQRQLEKGQQVEFVPSPFPLGNIQKAIEMAIEIVDLPINSMVIFHGYVSLPEGNMKNTPEIIPNISRICVNHCKSPTNQWFQKSV